MSAEKFLLSKINEVFLFASRRNTDWNEFDALMKWDEEFGELSEALMIVSGRITHKTLSEHPVGEIADNINQLMDFVTLTDNKTMKSFDFDTSQLNYEEVKWVFQQFTESQEHFKLEKSVEFIRSLYLCQRDLRRQARPIEPLSIDLTIYNLVVIGIYANLMFEKIDFNTFTESDYENSLNVISMHIDKKLNKWKGIQTSFGK